jgi:hypothetical protein
MFRTDHISQAWNLDASESIFVARELLKVRTQVYAVQYPQFKGDVLVPLFSDQPSVGQTHYTYQYRDRVGQAKLSASLSTGSPGVGVTLTEATPVPLRWIDQSYWFSLDDMRKAMAANKPLAMWLAEAARATIEQKRDEINLIGDGTVTYFGLYGLFKLSGTVTYTVPNGALGSPLWSLKTPDEMVADVFGLINKIYFDSNEVERPNTVVFPTSAWQDMTKRRMGDGGQMSVWDYVTAAVAKAYPGMMFETSIRLETAGAASARRMVAYEKNPEKIGRLDPNPFEQLPPQVAGYRTTTHCLATVGGVITPFPKSVGYADTF